VLARSLCGAGCALRSFRVVCALFRRAAAAPLRRCRRACASWTAIRLAPRLRPLASPFGLARPSAVGFWPDGGGFPLFSTLAVRLRPARRPGLSPLGVLLGPVAWPAWGGGVRRAPLALLVVRFPGSSRQVLSAEFPGGACRGDACWFLVCLAALPRPAGWRSLPAPPGPGVRDWLRGRLPCLCRVPMWRRASSASLGLGGRAVSLPGAHRVVPLGRACRWRLRCGAGLGRWRPGFCCVGGRFPALPAALRFSFALVAAMGCALALPFGLSSGAPLFDRCPPASCRPRCAPRVCGFGPGPRSVICPWLACAPCRVPPSGVAWVGAWLCALLFPLCFAALLRRLLSFPVPARPRMAGCFCSAGVPSALAPSRCCRPGARPCAPPPFAVEARFPVRLSLGRGLPLFLHLCRWSLGWTGPLARMRCCHPVPVGAPAGVRRLPLACLLSVRGAAGCHSRGSPCVAARFRCFCPFALPGSRCLGAWGGWGAGRPDSRSAAPLVRGPSGFPRLLRLRAAAARLSVLRGFAAGLSRCPAAGSRVFASWCWVFAWLCALVPRRPLHPRLSSGLVAGSPGSKWLAGPSVLLLAPAFSAPPSAGFPLLRSDPSGGGLSRVRQAGGAFRSRCRPGGVLRGPAAAALGLALPVPLWAAPSAPEPVLASAVAVGAAWPPASCGPAARPSSAVFGPMPRPAGRPWGVLWPPPRSVVAGPSRGSPVAVGLPASGGSCGLLRVAPCAPFCWLRRCAGAPASRWRGRCLAGGSSAHPPRRRARARCARAPLPGLALAVCRCLHRGVRSAPLLRLLPSCAPAYPPGGRALPLALVLLGTWLLGRTDWLAGGRPLSVPPGACSASAARFARSAARCGPRRVVPLLPAVPACAPAGSGFSRPGSRGFYRGRAARPARAGPGGAASVWAAVASARHRRRGPRRGCPRPNLVTPAGLPRSLCAGLLLVRRAEWRSAGWLLPPRPARACSVVAGSGRGSAGVSVPAPPDLAADVRPALWARLGSWLAPAASCDWGVFCSLAPERRCAYAAGRPGGGLACCSGSRGARPALLTVAWPGGGAAPARSTCGCSGKASAPGLGVLAGGCAGGRAWRWRASCAGLPRAVARVRPGAMRALPARALPVGAPRARSRLAAVASCCCPAGCGSSRALCHRCLRGGCPAPGCA